MIRSRRSGSPGLSRVQVESPAAETLTHLAVRCVSMMQTGDEFSCDAFVEPTVAAHCQAEHDQTDGGQDDCRRDDDDGRGIGSICQVSGRDFRRHLFDPSGHIDALSRRSAGWGTFGPGWLVSLMRCQSRRVSSARQSTAMVASPTITARRKPTVIQVDTVGIMHPSANRFVHGRVDHYVRRVEHRAQAESCFPRVRILRPRRRAWLGTGSGVSERTLHDGHPHLRRILDHGRDELVTDVADAAAQIITGLRSARANARSCSRTRCRICETCPKSGSDRTPPWLMRQAPTPNPFERAGLPSPAPPAPMSCGVQTKGSPHD